MIICTCMYDAQNFHVITNKYKHNNFLTKQSLIKMDAITTRYTFELL